MGLFDGVTDWIKNLFSPGTSGIGPVSSGIDYGKMLSGDSSSSSGGWLTNLLPSLTLGGLGALSSYQGGKREDSLNDKNLALKQQELAQEKELAYARLAQAAAANAENAAVMKKKILVDALTQAAQGAINVGNNQANTSLNVGQMLQNPLMRSGK